MIMHFIRTAHADQTASQSLTINSDYRPIDNDVADLLGWLDRTYGSPAIFVMDGGYGDCGTLYDEDRIQYMKQYASALRDGI